MRARRGRLGRNRVGAFLAFALLTGVLAVADLPLATTAHAGTWSLQSSGTSNALRGVSCPAAGTCFAVGGSGTIRATTNSGATWSAQSSGTTNDFYAVTCPTSTSCYALGDGGIIRTTTNGGASWITRTSGTTNRLASVSCTSATTCFVVGLAGTIRRTTDGGATWGAQTSGTTAPLYGISCPSTTTCYAVGDTGTVRVTTDGGSTWTAKTSGTTNHLLAVSCPTVSVCFAGGYGGTVIRTTDGGWTWATQPTGTTLILYISCSSAAACYIAGDSGMIRKTTNAGATWSAESSPTTNNLRAVACAPSDGCWVVGFSGTIAKGPALPAASWTTQSSPTTSTLRGVSCPSTDTCFAAGGNGIIVNTTDGGATWSAKYSFNVFYEAMACPTTTRCFAVGASGAIRATTDGGATWTSQASGTSATLTGISCPTATICYAVGLGGTILATTDGSTWAAQSSGTSRALYAVSCPSSQACYAVGEYGTVRSTTTAGATWTSLSSAPSGHLLGVSCPDVTTCFAVGYIGAVVATSNAGATWSSQWSGTSVILAGISCPSTQACYAAGDSGVVLATSDAGASWSPQTTATAYNLGAISCSQPVGCTAVGGYGAIVHADADWGDPCETACAGGDDPVDGSTSWLSPTSSGPEDTGAVGNSDLNVCYPSGATCVDPRGYEGATDVSLSVTSTVGLGTFLVGDHRAETNALSISIDAQGTETGLHGSGAVDEFTVSGSPLVPGEPLVRFYGTDGSYERTDSAMSVTLDGLVELSDGTGVVIAQGPLTVSLTAPFSWDTCDSSGCSTPAATFHGGMKPPDVASTGGAPRLTGTNPPSPADDPSPEVTGVAPDGSSVTIYPTPDCSGEAAATGTSDDLSNGGITVWAPDDSTTTFSATATDTGGHVSPCSSPTAYSELLPPEVATEWTYDPNATYLEGDITTRMEAEGITHDEAVRRFHVEDAVAGMLTTEVETRWPHTFAGLWIDGPPESATFGVSVAFTSDAQANVDQLRSDFPFPGDLTPVTAAMTLSELEAIEGRMTADRTLLQNGAPPPDMSQIVRDTEGHYDLGIDVQSNNLVVSVDIVSNELRDAFRATYTDRITLEEGVSELTACTQADCRLAMLGGLEIRSPLSATLDEQCSSAFAAVSNDSKRFALTAGHCFQRKDEKTGNDSGTKLANWYQGGSLYGTVDAARTMDSNVDAARIKRTSTGTYNGWQESSKVWVAGEPYPRKITKYKTRSQITVGSRAWKSGATTGTTIGKVVKTSVRPFWSKDEGGFIQATYCSDVGDSGGAVFVDEYAVGIHSAGSKVPQRNYCTDRNGHFQSAAGGRGTFGVIKDAMDEQHVKLLTNAYVDPLPRLSVNCNTGDCYFIVSGSRDYDGLIKSFSVTYGDGTGSGTIHADPATYNTWIHRYSKTGTYYPRLTVTDNDGRTRSRSVKVVVSLDPPKLKSATADIIRCQVVLEWDAPTAGDYPERYEVYRSKSGASYQRITSNVSSAATSYTDTKVVANTTYTYYMTSVAGLVHSSGSNKKSAKTQLICVPAAL